MKGSLYGKSDVVITRDDVTGTVTMSEWPGPAAWDTFFRLRDETDMPSDFLKERPLNSRAKSGDVFDDWAE